MFELTEKRPPVNVPETEYRRLLGYPPDREPAPRARELAETARQWYRENGRPWIYAREIEPVDWHDSRLTLAGVEFSSVRLRERFAEGEAHGAVLVAVSAGGECEEHARELWLEEKPDEYYFLESFGSAVAEHLVTVAAGRICAWAEENHLAVLPHGSPGFSGWNIADQGRLWNLIRAGAPGGLPGELEILDSGMPRPKKSQLAVFGLTHRLAKARRLSDLIPCEECSLAPCQFRRAPYRPPRTGHSSGW